MHTQFLHNVNIVGGEQTMYRPCMLQTSCYHCTNPANVVSARNNSCQVNHESIPDHYNFPWNPYLFDRDMRAAAATVEAHVVDAAVAVVVHGQQSFTAQSAECYRNAQLKAFVVWDHPSITA